MARRHVPYKRDSHTNLIASLSSNPCSSFSSIKYAITSESVNSELDGNNSLKFEMKPLWNKVNLFDGRNTGCAWLFEI